MSFSKILQDIEQRKFVHFYLLHGEEPYYIDELSNAIITNALAEEERDFNQTIVYGKEAQSATLLGLGREYPMMAERKVVVLKEAQDFKDLDDLLPLAESKAENNVFVVCYKYKNYDSRKKLLKAVEKSGGVVFKSEKVKDYQLADWIANFSRTKGYPITSKAAMLLAEFLGSDLSRIANEIEKLTILIEPGTTIGDVHIEENIGISKDYNLFELSNAVMNRDILTCYKIINYFEHNPKAGSIVPVVSNLFKLFSSMLRIHFLPSKNKGEIAVALKIHPFVAQQYIQATRIFDARKLAANIAILQEYDLKSKGINNASASDAELMREMVYQLLHA